MTDSAWNDPPWRAPRPDDRGTAGTPVTSDETPLGTIARLMWEDMFDVDMILAVSTEPEQNRNDDPPTQAESASDLR